MSTTLLGERATLAARWGLDWAAAGHHALAHSRANLDTPALKKASKGVKQEAFKSLSQCAGEQRCEEMALLGQQRFSVVEKAQQRVLAAVGAQVPGFRLMALVPIPLEELEGIEPGGEVVAAGRPVSIGVGSALVGPVIDGQGRPVDGDPPPAAERCYPLLAQPPSPLACRRISEPVDLGVRPVSALLTGGKGQRLGALFRGDVGKSVSSGVIPCQPSAEFLRDRARYVFLLTDSIMRVGPAQTPVGRAVGEPPASRGPLLFPPSCLGCVSGWELQTGAQ